MNALCRRLSILALSTTLGLTACGTEIGGTLYVVGNTVPQSSTCLVQAQGGGGQQAFRSKGAMDLSVTSRYVAYFLVKNMAPQFESISGFEAEQGRMDQSMITLNTATITMSMSAGLVQTYNQVMSDAAQSLGLSAALWNANTCDASRCTTAFTLPISAEVPPGESSAVVIDLVPPNYGNILRHLPIFVQAGLEEGPSNIALGNAEIELIFNIQLSGKRHDGKEVSSEPFTYSVIICNNCLVVNEYPPDVAVNPFAPEDGSEPISVDEIVGDICAPGSDEEVTNAWCSVAYEIGSCQQQRCLTGVGQATPTGSDLTLYCPNDGVFYSPSNL